MHARYDAVLHAKAVHSGASGVRDSVLQTHGHLHAMGLVLGKSSLWGWQVASDWWEESSDFRCATRWHAALKAA